MPSQALQSTDRRLTPGAVGDGRHSTPGKQPLVLVVGANADHRASLAEIFENEGFSAEEADTPWAAEHAAESDGFDLIVLDGKLQEGGAIAVCRRLASSQRAPIIVLSEDADVTDRIIALEVGADDLIGRPVNKRELVARARALLRRSMLPPASRSFEDCDANSGTLQIPTRVLIGPNGRRVPLPPSIFAVLQVFLSRLGQPVTAELAAELLGHDVVSVAHFRTTIVRLRKKLTTAGFDQRLLASIRSGGYLLEPELRITTSYEARRSHGVEG